MKNQIGGLNHDFFVLDELVTASKMKKYVFSYINFFDNVLTSKVIESDLDAFHVAFKEFCDRGWDLDDEDLETLEDLKKFAFNCDTMIEIIEV